MSRNILIISHTFPPASGIGGRRWAKFAKYLSRAGHTVQVITSENIAGGTASEWTRDAKDLPVEALPYNYPKSLVTPVKSFWDKISYRFALLRVRMLDQGNYYDKGIFWKKQIQERVSDYIRNKSVDTVIVTGAPFRLVYYVTTLKPMFPNVTFISDFRDLWTEDLEISAFSLLSTARRNVEKQYEKETVNNSDVVLTVSESMKNYFAGLTGKNNCFVIPNGYDPDDLPDVKNEMPFAKDDSKKVRFVFAGTLYNNLDYILAPFFKAVKQLKEQRPELYAAFHFEFYGKFPENYKKYILDNGLSDSIHIFGEKPYAVVSAKMHNAHFGVLFLNDLYNFSFSTKFCEYIAQKKKIVVISNKGGTADYITTNRLGFHLDSEKPFDGLVNSIESVIAQNFSIQLNEHFDEAVFSIARISKDVEKHLATINLSEGPSMTSVMPKKETKDLLFTFDYELFLGKNSGSVDNCMLKPTQLVLDVLKEHGIKKAVFFIDTVYLSMLENKKEAATTNDFNRIRKQLIQIVKDGHYVFPHIHPHWKDASYDSGRNQWKLESIRRYRFHHITAAERKELFDYAIRFIKNIQEEAQVYFPVSGYRAGGWCIQPFSDFRPYFIENNITHDFSVLKRFKFSSASIHYDFTNMPGKNIYRFEHEVETEDRNGTFTEYSISNIQVSGFDSLLNKFLLKYFYFFKRVNFGDGNSVDKTGSGSEEIQDHDSLNEDNIEMASFELVTQAKIAGYKKMLDTRSYIQFITHPKMLSDHNIKYFRKFLQYASSNYELQTDFTKMKAS